MKWGFISASLLLACITSLNALSVQAATGCPSNLDAPKPLPGQISVGDIRSWLGTKENFELGEYSDVILCDKEVAILAQVTFENRGRNFAHAVLLIRPHKRTAVELTATHFTITNLSGANNPTIVDLTAESFGHGRLEGLSTLVQFNGDKPITLHEQSYYNKEGACLENEACDSVSLEWIYKQDEAGPFLVEKIINSTTMNDRPMSHEQITNRYRYTVNPQFNKIN